MILTLAPLDGYTDCAFREIIKKHGKPDLVFTEFVNCQGLIRAFERLIETLRYTEFQRPIIAQLFGKDPEYFYKASLVVCHLGFDGIDINMGCPAKNIANKGGGAALIQKPKLALEIIKAVKKARSAYTNDRDDLDDLHDLIDMVNKKIDEWKIKVRKKRKITVSIKTRAGYEKDITENWIKTLTKAKPDFITLHARTFRQGFKGKADWQAIKQAVKSSNIPIIGNGDVTSYKDCQTMIKQTGCTGVMIGRAAIGKPWIFKPKATYRLQQIKKIALEHARLYVKFKGERKFYEMRKHLMAYFRGFRNVKVLRKKISSVNDIVKLKEILEQHTVKQLSS